MANLRRIGRVIADDEDEPWYVERPLWHPTRWPVLLGLVVVSVAAWLPWETKPSPDGPYVITGISNYSAAGLQLILFGALTLIASALPAVARTRTRTVQLMPALAGLTTFLLYVGAYNARAADVGSWGTLDAGIWFAMYGSVLLALGGTFTTLFIVGSRPTQGWVSVPNPGFAWWRAVFSGGAGLVLAIVLAVLISPANASAANNDYAIEVPAVILLGAFAFGYATYACVTVAAWFWRRVAQGPR